MSAGVQGEIDCRCPHCRERSDIALTKPHCPKCQQPILIHATERFHTEGIVDQCLVCGCAHVYRQKDFNRKLGIALIVLGILLAYYTYGLSILAVTILDWWIGRRVGEVGVCYQCGAVYRDLSTISKLEPFQLQIHDYYRSRASEAGLEPNSNLR